jgi:hypothetical protein
MRSPPSPGPSDELQDIITIAQQFPTFPGQGVSTPTQVQNQLMAPIPSSDPDAVTIGSASSGSETVTVSATTTGSRTSTAATADATVHEFSIRASTQPVPFVSETSGVGLRAMASAEQSVSLHDYIGERQRYARVLTEIGEGVSQVQITSWLMQFGPLRKIHFMRDPRSRSKICLIIYKHRKSARKLTRSFGRHAS